MADFDLAVTGRVIRADRVPDNGYLAVRDGQIERVGEGAPPPAAERQDFFLSGKPVFDVAAVADPGIGRLVRSARAGAAA